MSLQEQQPLLRDGNLKHVKKFQHILYFKNHFNMSLQTSNWNEK